MSEEAHFDFALDEQIDLADPQQVLNALGISPRETDCAATTVRIPMRDDVELAAEHYAPPTDKPAPTLLVRSPYGRGFPYDVLLAKVFAGAGYHVLLQSCRGTADSDGELRPMVQEAADGHDTVDWLREQPWFDGRLGLIGMSYLAYCAYALLQDPPPEVKAAVIVVGPYDFGSHFHRTGAFTVQECLSWSNLVRRPSPAVADELPADAARRLPLLAGAELLGPTAPWYRDWIAHPDIADPFWRPYDHHAALQHFAGPTLLIGGAYDVFLPQTLAAFQALSSRGVPTALTLGPWVHTDVVATAAATMVDEAQSWFDDHLRDGVVALNRPAVRLHIAGAEEWRELPGLPAATGHLTLRLSGDGSLTADGGAGSSTFTYDPADPTPTVGGRRVAPDGGARDNAPREQRRDVLTFTTAPFERPVEIHGNPTLSVGFTLDSPHADLHARLCVVDTDGTSINFSDAMLRLPLAEDPATPRVIELTLDFCARRITSGQRIRLQLSGGSYPEYDRNLGTGEPPATGTAMATSTHVIDHATTSLLLPVSDPA
ncbi:CocE/NonD family hydrolase [Kutzneria sp. CA-103260]|uniref:CocE/NonD family hydrolase n=1 Tax=Kutzneria sp. CA-103260 TaxID=2802641 RepID=UPI001BA60B71|nr:CocE/NonD family hydrolase [Kutzneria sp. CA-103260]QUQ64443.1 hydrolase [Kutzneria sp. CA-103260]